MTEGQRAKGIHGRAGRAIHRVGARLSRSGRMALVAGSSLLLSGYEGGILNPQGPVGAAEKTILFNSLAIMLAIIVPTSILTVFFAWWFRESNTKAKFRPTFVYSGGIELVVWGIPTLVIIFLGGIIWIGTHQLDPKRSLEGSRKPVEVQVVSLDWKWLFIYPEEGVATINQLVVPAATPVHFQLTSASVMNAFFVPQLGSMIYTMFGMVTQLNLQADRKGDYYGRSSMFSGDGFPAMQFNLRAVSDSDYAGWLQDTKKAGSILDRDSYDTLLKEQNNMPPAGYGAVDPNLFSAISTGAIAPQPGPSTGHPSPDVKPSHGGG